ncbi:DUF2569 family protein [Paenibacillus sp. GCM10027626]|uniref:DUF2569 family protein n=1 Tax=Paenibacillus sp. GCM10027626 TaxID=3273411 RepID=UPI003632DCCD
MAGKSSLPVKGFGGWLILVQIVLWLSFAGTAMHFLVDLLPIQSGEKWLWLTTPGSPAYDPMWKTIIRFEVYGNLALLLLLALSIICFYKQKRMFISLIIAYLIAIIIVTIVAYGLVQASDMLAAQRTGMSSRKVMQNIATSAVLIPYFIKSARVKNTFVK